MVVAGLVPFTVLVLILFGTAYSLVVWQPPLLQTTQFGIANSGNGITALVADRTGVYAAGYSGFSFSDPGVSNVNSTYPFVNKYDFNGHQVWSQHIAGPIPPWMDASVGTDGLYVAGGQFFLANANSSFVRKYDISGNEVWNIQFGNWSATSISVSPSGVYVGGDNRTAYVVDGYSLSGTLLWTRLFGTGAGNIYVRSSPDGVYVVAEDGSLQEFGLDGTLTWARSCSCDVTGLSGESAYFYIVGDAPTSKGTYDGFLSKYDSSGDQIWTKSFSAPGFNSIRKVKAAADSSGIYLTATGAGIGGIAMKFDSNGNMMWSVQLPLDTGFGIAWSDAIALGDSAAYIGGSSGSDRVNLAFLTILEKASSLIFFGLNPPFSFVLAGLLVAGSALSILWFRRQRLKKRRIPGARGIYRPQKTR